MSDGGRGRVSLGVEMWMSSQKWSVERSAVRSIAWLDLVAVVNDTTSNQPINLPSDKTGNEIEHHISNDAEGNDDNRINIEMIVAIGGQQHKARGPQDEFDVTEKRMTNMSCREKDDRQESPQYGCGEQKSLQWTRIHGSNENKMSDAHRERALTGMKVRKPGKTRTHNGWAFAPSHG